MLIAEIRFINVIKNFELARREAENLIRTMDYFDAETRTLHTSVTLEVFYFFSVSILSRGLVTSTGRNLQTTKTILVSERPSVLSFYFRRGIENIYELSET